MLRALLNELDRATGPLTRADLARTLGVDALTLDAMLGHLVRIGRLDDPDRGPGEAGDASTACGHGGCDRQACVACPLPVRLPTRLARTDRKR